MFVGFKWYRHSGQPEIDKLPNWRDISDLPGQSLAEVKAEVGDNYITHAYMSLPDGLDSSLADILSKVTHLGIHEVVSSTSLHRYS